MANKFTLRAFKHVQSNLFKYSLFIKGFDGIIEIIAGTGLIFIRPETINTFVYSLVHGELVEEPGNKAAHYLLTYGHVSSQGALFAAILLLLRGVVKIIVITGLLQRRIWVYPMAIIVFTAFTIYQMYIYFVSPSLFLLLLSIFDVVVIALTVREYKIVKKKTTH